MANAATRPSIDLGRLAPDLRDTCDDYCGSYRRELAEMVRRGDGGVDVAHRHSRILDGLLGALFCAANGAARAGGPGPTGRVALIAVGGYGRGLVGLESDVDVLFLCDDPNDPHVAALAEGLLYPLWDLGLEIGHAVRGVDETLSLAQQDIRTATTLLDMRPVGGDRALLQQLKDSAYEQLFGDQLSSFLEGLERDRRARHERFGGSRFLLEPEVKLGCGGLRDLDLALWAAKGRWRAADIEELVAGGALSEREGTALTTAREMLWRTRNLLHLRAKRRQDRLTFEDQEEIATLLGFVPGVTLAVEQFMQAYYRHATVVEQTTERLLESARERERSEPAPRVELGHGILAVGERLTFADSAELADHPAMALRLYQTVSQRGQAALPAARDAIARVSATPSWPDTLRADPSAARLFLDILTSTARHPERHRSVFSELHDLGLLLAMIPEFEPVTGRVQHDVYHIYTVDVHSVAAVDRLKAIKRGEYAAELPLASRLAAELSRTEPLFLGLLLHDIGKAEGRNHSATGARMAKPIAERLGLAPADVAHVVWLVEEHLSLYHWATRRDTSDPTVVREIAQSVGSLDRLRDLYLLTIADLSTTNPAAMTSWKERMLEDLYIAVSAELAGEVHSANASFTGRVRMIRAEFASAASTSDVDRRAMEFVETMPSRYVLAQSPEAVRAHSAIAAQRNGRAVHVAVRPGPSEEVDEIIVIAEDRAGLLADLAAAVASQRLSIVGAQVYTRARDGGRREAFDIFHVRREVETAGVGAVDESRLTNLRTDLQALEDGGISAADLLARRHEQPSWARRHSPEVPTEIRVDNHASPRFTVIDVFTRDRPALLHAIARTLHEQALTIGLSKVSTEGEKAADIFYVTDATGSKLKPGPRLEELPASIRAAIATLDAGSS